MTRVRHGGKSVTGDAALSGGLGNDRFRQSRRGTWNREGHRNDRKAFMIVAEME